MHEEAGVTDSSSDSDDEWAGAALRRSAQPGGFKPDVSPGGVTNVQPTFGPRHPAAGFLEYGGGAGASVQRDFRLTLHESSVAL